MGTTRCHSGAPARVALTRLSDGQSGAAAPSPSKDAGSSTPQRPRLARFSKSLATVARSSAFLRCQKQWTIAEPSPLLRSFPHLYPLSCRFQSRRLRRPWLGFLDTSALRREMTHALRGLPAQ